MDNKGNIVSVKYKASMEDVLYFLKSGRKLPPNCANLDKTMKIKRMHSLAQYSSKFAYDHKDNTLYYVPKHGTQANRQTKKVRVLFSRPEIERVLADIHGSGTKGSHMGTKRTQANISERFYWRSMTEDVKHWIATCPECQKGQKKNLVPELKPISAAQPWEKVGVDLVGPLTTTSRGFKYILTGTCLFSKWVEAEPIVDNSAESVFHGLMKWMHRWGAPLRILADLGREFNNKKLNELFFKRYQIRNLVSAAYHPQTNGQDVRTNCSIMRHLSKMINEQLDDWDLYTEQACWGLRSSYNESTKTTPYQIMTMRRPRFPSELPTDHDSDKEESYLSSDHHEPNLEEVAAYISGKESERIKLEEQVNNNTKKAKERTKKYKKLKREKRYKSFSFHEASVSVGATQRKLGDARGTALHLTGSMATPH